MRWAARLYAAERRKYFERSFSLWVAACMLASILLGKVLPGFIDGMRAVP